MEPHARHLFHARAQGLEELNSLIACGARIALRLERTTSMKMSLSLMGISSKNTISYGFASIILYGSTRRHWWLILHILFIDDTSPRLSWGNHVSKKCSREGWFFDNILVHCQLIYKDIDKAPQGRM